MLHAAYLPQLEDSMKGKEREIFILSHLQNAGYKVYYPDRGDFITNKYVFEVGDKNKTKNQIRDIDNAYIAASGILVGDKNTIPLYLFGLLY